MDFELSDASIKKLAHAMVLAPYEVVSEGVANWTEGSKEYFAGEAKGKDIHQQVKIYLEMKDKAEAATAREAKKEAARKAALEKIVAEREAREKATLEANRAQNAANKTAYKAACASAKINGLTPPPPAPLPENIEDLRLHDLRQHIHSVL